MTLPMTSITVALWATLIVLSQASHISADCTNADNCNVEDDAVVLLQSNFQRIQGRIVKGKGAQHGQDSWFIDKLKDKWNKFKETVKEKACAAISKISEKLRKLDDNKKLGRLAALKGSLSDVGKYCKNATSSSLDEEMLEKLPEKLREKLKDGGCAKAQEIASKVGDKLLQWAHKLNEKRAKLGAKLAKWEEKCSKSDDSDDDDENENEDEGENNEDSKDSNEEDDDADEEGDEIDKEKGEEENKDGNEISELLQDSWFVDKFKDKLKEAAGKLKDKIKEKACDAISTISEKLKKVDDSKRLGKLAAFKGSLAGVEGYCKEHATLPVDEETLETLPDKLRKMLGKKDASCAKVQQISIKVGERLQRVADRLNEARGQLAEKLATLEERCGNSDDDENNDEEEEEAEEEEEEEEDGDKNDIDEIDDDEDEGEQEDGKSDNGNAEGRAE